MYSLIFATTFIISLIILYFNSNMNFNQNFNIEPLFSLALFFLFLYLFIKYVFFRRWFWNIIFKVLFYIFIIGAIASSFSMLASIIHFQILWALGYLFLTGLCVKFASWFEKLSNN